MKFVIFTALLVTWAQTATYPPLPPIRVLPFTISYPEETNKEPVESQALFDTTRNVSATRFPEEGSCFVRQEVPTETEAHVYVKFYIVPFTGDPNSFGPDVARFCSGYAIQLAQKDPATAKRSVDEEDRHYNNYYYRPQIYSCSYYYYYPYYYYGYPYYQPAPPPPPPPPPPAK